MSLFGPGPLADGLGWGLFGRAGRSWDSVAVVGAAQIVDAMALSLSRSVLLARGVEGKQRCCRDGTGVAVPPGSAQDCGCWQLGDSSLWLWPRMTDSGCLLGERAGWLACVGRAQVFPRLRGAGCVVEGKGLQEKRRVPKGWSGTEWPSLAHNSLATLGPLKLQAYHLSSLLFLTAKRLEGAPERECLGTMTWARTVTLVHYQVERNRLGSLTPPAGLTQRGWCSSRRPPPSFPPPNRLPVLTITW